MKSEDVDKWDLIIKPQTGLLELKLQEVWRYRDLLRMFVKRDFVAFYKQTILGPIWFFIQPLFTMAVYVLVFGNLAGISTEGIPKPLFYLVGITTWSYFSDCLTKTANVFRDNSHIFGKVYFPRLIMPLSIIVSNLVRFGVQFILLLVCMVYYYAMDANFSATSYLLLLPILVVLMASLGLGLGMIISALTTKYRDMALLLTFGIQLLMYGTTVIYPLSSLSGTVHTIVALNPITPVIEGMRKGLLGSGSFDLIYFGYCSIVAVIVLVIGIITFNKVQKNFIDTV